MEVLKQGALSLGELQGKILRNAKYCVEAVKLYDAPIVPIAPHERMYPNILLHKIYTVELRLL